MARGMLVAVVSMALLGRSTGQFRDVNDGPPDATAQTHGLFRDVTDGPAEWAGHPAVAAAAATEATPARVGGAGYVHRWVCPTKDLCEKGEEDEQCWDYWYPVGKCSALEHNAAAPDFPQMNISACNAIGVVMTLLDSDECTWDCPCPAYSLNHTAVVLKTGECNADYEVSNGKFSRFTCETDLPDGTHQDEETPDNAGDTPEGYEDGDDDFASWRKVNRDMGPEHDDGEHEDNDGGLDGTGVQDLHPNMGLYANPNAN